MLVAWIAHKYRGLVLLVAFMILKLGWTPVPVVLFLALAIVTIGSGFLYTNALPFALDQMIGAPAEELSAAVQWYCWGSSVGYILITIFNKVSKQQQYLDILSMVLLGLSFCCLTGILLLDCLYSETCLIRSGLGLTCCGLIRQVAALHLTLVMRSVTCL